MEIIEFIQKINILTNSKREYDTYSYIFKEYIDFLETRLKLNASDTKAVCQLAIMYYEDRRDVAVCLGLMEDALKKYELCISKESICELLNNIAYFYDVECGDDIKAELALKRAIELNSDYPSSYYALAYLKAESNPSFALDIIKHISFKGNLPIQYKFLHGYILMRNYLFEDALKYFEDLSQHNDVEIVEKSLYNCAIIYSINGEASKSSIIAEKLFRGYKEGENVAVSTFELIHLFFILQNYEKVVGLFGAEKIENIYVDVQIIKLLFYALNNLGLKAECEKTFQNKTNEIMNEINEIEIDSDISDIEKLDYIKDYQNDLKVLSQHYLDIVLNNVVVKVDDNFYYSKSNQQCYLIDCPRHFVE